MPEQDPLTSELEALVQKDSRNFKRERAASLLLLGTGLITGAYTLANPADSKQLTEGLYFGSIGLGLAGAISYAENYIAHRLLSKIKQR